MHKILMQTMLMLVNNISLYLIMFIFYGYLCFCFMLICIQYTVNNLITTVMFDSESQRG